MVIALRRRCAVFAVLAALAVAASGCASATGAAAPAPSEVAASDAGDVSAPTGSVLGTQHGPAAETRHTPANFPAGTASPEHTGASQVAPGAVNALELTGPVVADEVPDMTPVLTDVAPSLPARVTDANGDVITVERAKRVIALDLYGTLTDTIIGLGLGDRLVGRAVSDTQEVLEDLPVVSNGGIGLNAEAVLNLKPDVILTNLTIGSERIYSQLEAAGVTVVRFDQTPTIDAIGDEIRRVAAVFGMSEAADQLVSSTEQHLAVVRGKIEALAAATPRPPRAVVLYIRGAGGIFFILGADYGAAGILAELHLADVAGENGITNVKPANAEALVSLNPEIILAMQRGVESAGGVAALLDRPGIAATTAGQHRRVIMADDSQLLSYGPRTPSNLLALARAIYTDDANQ